MRLVKTWTAIDKLSVVWKSDLTDKIKHSFFQAAVVSILLYGCTTLMLTKRMEKKLNSNYTRMLWVIGLVGRVFANGPGNRGSIPGHVIPKTLKMVLDASLLNTQQYKVCIKVKVEQSRKGIVPSPTPRCSSYWKGSLLVSLNYGRQLYLLEETPDKTAAVLPPTAHHKNYPS